MVNKEDTKAQWESLEIVYNQQKSVINIFSKFDLHYPIGRGREVLDIAQEELSILLATSHFG